jgi:hypothetical protein
VLSITVPRHFGRLFVDTAERSASLMDVRLARPNDDAVLNRLDYLSLRYRRERQQKPLHQSQRGRTRGEYRELV